MEYATPTDFDPSAYERRTEVRRLGVRYYPGGDNPRARGHEFELSLSIGMGTECTLTANAAELRQWSRTLAEEAIHRSEVLDGEDGPECPTCHGDVHVDLSGQLWTEKSRALEWLRYCQRRPSDTDGRQGHGEEDS